MSTQETYLTAIANAIRAKTGATAAIQASQFAAEIAKIQSAPKLQELSVYPSKTKQIIAPGTGYDGLSKVTVYPYNETTERLVGATTAGSYLTFETTKGHSQFFSIFGMVPFASQPTDASNAVIAFLLFFPETTDWSQVPTLCPYGFFVKRTGSSFSLSTMTALKWTIGSTGGNGVGIGPNNTALFAPNVSDWDIIVSYK